MTVALGASPLPMELVLSPGANFVCTFRRPAGDWADGTAIEIRVAGAVWPATIAGDEANWDVAKAVVDALLATEPRHAKVFHTLAGVESLWFSGPVDIRG